MNIRNAEQSDYDRVLDVMVDWWGGRDLQSMVYQGLFLHFKQTSFIVEDEKGDLVAFLLGYFSQTFINEAYINWIGVHPGYRNKGIARLLYERFFEVTERKRGSVQEFMNSPIFPRLPIPKIKK